MTTYQKVDKTELKDAVNKQLENLVTEKDVVIAGARLTKDGRLELEFVQSRKLRNSKTSVLSLINKGDDRFNQNTRQVLRIWHTIDLENAKKVFGFDFQPIADTAKDMIDSQRVMVMAKIDKFFVDGKVYQLNIRVRETSDITKLPKSMREDIEQNNQYAENHKLQLPTGENGEFEPVVDANGKLVYHWNELEYINENQQVVDELINKKFLISEFYNPRTRLDLFKEKNKKLVIDSRTTKSNEKVYITRSNLERITRKVKPDVVFDGEIHERPIYFFSEFEIKRLLSVKSFIKNPYAFIENYYLPVITEDSNRYIFEEGSPAYHRRQDCERLNSNFINFEIPLKIKQQGKEKINEFRKWFKENLHLLNNPDVFAMRLRAKFGITTNPKAIEYENRGISEFDNLNLYFIPAAIDKFVFKAADFYNSSSENEKNILKKFSKHTYLAFSDAKIKDNDTGLSDSELKKFLKDYDSAFKKPIRNLIIKKFIEEANEDLRFDSTLLDKLGFKPCKNCHN